MSSRSTAPAATRRPTRAARAGGGAGDYLDQRTGISLAIKGFARKIFPDHWSFLLGEIALFSFVVLLITGVFIALFFVPSMGLVIYDGSFPTMHGVEMSEAYASTLDLSFEVTGGLLMRQMHHWAALLFMASIVVHMMRVFFTGAFRKPREINWVVGFTLLILGLGAGFTGYSLPDDVLSGNGLRITDGVVKSIPVIGSYTSLFIFGGEFPGEMIIPRLFVLHIFLIPGLILALIGLHLLLVVLHKHTQYPGPGRTQHNVVGYPFLPIYIGKQAGFLFMIFGFLALMGGTMTINPVWNYGPYDPSPVTAGAQPDWYMLFLEGALRLMPGNGWEPVVLGYSLPLNVLIPALGPALLLFGFIATYPFLEAWATGDKREHHLLDRPRNAPVRTGLGVAFLAAFLVLVLAGANDIIATHFAMSLNDITWTFRILLFALPVAAFWATKRICLGLQRKDRELVLHGHESGRIVRLASGEYLEVHTPLDEYERWLLVQHEPRRPLEILPAEDARGVRRKGYRRDRLRQAVSRFFYEDRVEPVTPAELEAAHSHGEHDALEAAAADRDVESGPETVAVEAGGPDTRTDARES